MLAHHLGGPVDEGADPRRQVPRIGIDHAHRHAGQAPFRQHLDQFAAGQQRAGLGQRHRDQPESGLGGGDVGATAVEAHCRWLLDDEGLLAAAQFGARLPAGGREHEGQVAVADQICRAVQWRGAGEVGRRGAEHEAHLADRSADQVGRGHRAAANRAVDAFLDQVDDALAAADVETDFRVAGNEVRQRRDDQEAADRRGHLHRDLATHDAAAAGHAGLQLVHVVEQGAGALVVGGAVGGRRHAARGAVQQLHPQLRLECLELA
ncbi:hypothetical protein D9M69_469590 [compost metagenome]